jgi:hypothetical protein
MQPLAAPFPRDIRMHARPVISKENLTILPYFVQQPREDLSRDQNDY